MKRMPTTFLDRVIASKHAETVTGRKTCPEEQLRDRASTRSDYRNFVAPLRAARSADKIGVIAELKSASPSAGILCENYIPARIAQDYERCGAHCLSVLTDAPYFKGSSEHLQLARAACELPVLRKDFIVSTYQVYESACIGADAILLIAAAFKDKEELASLAELAIAVGMNVLLEIHAAEEWHTHHHLARLPEVLVGINHRNLHDLTIDLDHTRRLAPEIAEVSPNPVIAESGIQTARDIQKLRANGAHGFLIGTAFMGVAEPGQALRALLDESLALASNVSST